MSVLTQDAAGYGGLYNTPLARPYFYEKIMSRVYERDFLREITNSEIAERIKSCAQTVQIMKAPEVGRWRTYQLNQQMINSQVTPTAICLSICYAAYQSLKFDELTIHYACDNWAPFEEKILEGCYESFVADQRDWVFTSMLAEVPTYNRGQNAGKHRNINLGDVGSPRVVNRNTIVNELSSLRQVLSEHDHWVKNNMFMVVPPDLYPILAVSNYANKAWIGGSGSSVIIDGQWTDEIMGFTLYETNHLVAHSDSGHVCYYILAGHRDAFSYASEIIRARVVQGIDSFSTMYQMLAVWGGKMIYPEYIAVGYWYFDATV
jgi:hypothetical protein